MMPKLGDTASVSKTISQQDIEQFAELTGDRNPMHLDPKFAEQTRFGKTIAHGMWGASLISAVLGTKLPGPGAVYLSQTLKFQAPVYPGDTVTATAKVTKVRKDKPIVYLETICTNQDQAVIISGEAVALVESSD